ncbi:hypothetical protein OF363_00700 [Mycoplasma enhydrae]|uniref:hypothetical protein n=1 Tax=Mycoplasma enhydrae TaxID=2499220 RepID=UPI0021E901DD|nr:hypothetical protein [Mycoplasma enhydrae]MCV3733556.1 hypothetical protein [Mycoplasma enhydrae]
MKNYNFLLSSCITSKILLNIDKKANKISKSTVFLFIYRIFFLLSAISILILGAVRANFKYLNVMSSVIYVYPIILIVFYSIYILWAFSFLKTKIHNFIENHQNFDSPILDHLKKHGELRSYFIFNLVVNIVINVFVITSYISLTYYYSTKNNETLNYNSYLFLLAFLVLKIIFSNSTLHIMYAKNTKADLSLKYQKRNNLINLISIYLTSLITLGTLTFISILFPINQSWNLGWGFLVFLIALIPIWILGIFVFKLILFLIFLLKADCKTSLKLKMLFLFLFFK